MDLKKWLDETIVQPIFTILDELASEFKDDQGKLSWRNAIQIFTQFCNGTLDPKYQQVVDKIITKLNLASKYDSLKSFWQKIPVELRDTTKILQETTDAIIWSILSKDGKSIGTGEIIGPAGSILSFNAGSTQDKIDLVLSLKAMDNTASQQAIGIAYSNDQRIFEMGLTGTLSVSAGASLKSGFFNLSGNVNTGGTSASLDYYYLDEGKWLFLEAMFNNVPHIVSPFNAKAIAAAKANRLEAVNVNITGALNTMINIGINAAYGPTFTVSGSKLGLDTGDTKVSANMQAGLDFSSELNIEGNWTLLAKPKDDYNLSLSINNNQYKDTINKIALSASIGLSGLDTVGTALINKYLPSAQPLITQLEKYANPGNLLKIEISKQFDQLMSTDSNTLLKENLSRVLIGDETAAGIADVIGNAAESAFNNQLDKLEGDSETAAKKVLLNMAEKLKLPQNLTDDLVKKTNNEITKMLDNIKSNIEAQIKKIIDNNKDTLAVIFKPLEIVGNSINQVSKDMDKLAQELLSPIINFLSKYQALRQKISSIVADSANYSISMNLSRALTTEKSSVTVLEFDIDTREQNALDRYKEMMVGQFEKALADARKSPDGFGGIKLTGGTFKKVLQKKLTTDLNFRIFGLDIDAGTILSSDVALQVDAVTGDIMIAASKGIMSKYLKAFGEAQTVTFINLMGIPGFISKDDPTMAKSPEEKLLNGTGMVLTYSDKSLKRSELDDYIGSAQKSGLISKGSKDAILNRYDELVPSAKANNKAVQAFITLSMPLTSTDIAVLISKDDKVIHQTAMEKQLNFCFKNDNDRKRLGEYLARWFGSNAPSTLEEMINKIVETKAVAAGVISEGVTDPRLSGDSAETMRMNHYVGVARSIGTNSVNLVKIVQYVRDSAQMTITSENLSEVRGKIEKFNEDTNTYLKSWLKTSGLLSNLGFKSETIPGVTRAFVATIGELCQPKRETTKYYLVPTISWSTDGSTAPETF